MKIINEKADFSKLANSFYDVLLDMPEIKSDRTLKEVCENCGHINYPETKFCKVCGFDFSVQKNDMMINKTDVIKWLDEKSNGTIKKDEEAE